MSCSRRRPLVARRHVPAPAREVLRRQQHRLLDPLRLRRGCLDVEAAVGRAQAHRHGLRHHDLVLVGGTAALQALGQRLHVGARDAHLDQRRHARRAWCAGCSRPAGRSRCAAKPTASAEARWSAPAPRRRPEHGRSVRRRRIEARRRRMEARARPAMAPSGAAPDAVRQQRETGSAVARGRGAPEAAHRNAHCPVAAEAATTGAAPIRRARPEPAAVGETAPRRASAVARDGRRIHRSSAHLRTARARTGPRPRDRRPAPAPVRDRKPRPFRSPCGGS